MKKSVLKIRPRKHFVNGRQSIEGWENYLNEGKQYYRAVMKGALNRAKFTPVILYNIMTMSIEKYIMALCMYNGSLPENHTLTDLVRSVKEFLAIPEELEKKLLHLDGLQEICSLENDYRDRIGENDVPFILSTGSITQSFVESWLPL